MTLAQRITNALGNGNFYQHIIDEAVAGAVAVDVGTEWIINISLHNGATVTDDRISIGGNYADQLVGLGPFISTAETIVFTGGANDVAAGTGLRTMSIVGYQTTGDTYATEDLTLLGASGVTSTKTYNATLFQQPLSVGSLEVNDAAITAAPTTSTTRLQGQMDAKNGVTVLPIFAVAAGYQAEVFQFEPRSQVALACFGLAVRDYGAGLLTAPIIIDPVNIAANDNSPSILIPEKRIFDFTCIQTSGSDAQVGATIGIFFKKVS